MGSSLRAGLDAVAAADAVVLVTVDTPWLGVEAVRRLRAAYLAGASVVVATYEGERGHPVLLDRRQFAAVAALAEGDVGARVFLAAHPELVTAVPCDGTGSPRDIDTPADLGG
jgi:nicotine blue oxidoreductase